MEKRKSPHTAIPNGEGMAYLSPDPAGQDRTGSGNGGSARRRERGCGMGGSFLRRYIDDGPQKAGRLASGRAVTGDPPLFFSARSRVNENLRTLPPLRRWSPCPGRVRRLRTRESGTTRRSGALRRTHTSTISPREQSRSCGCAVKHKDRERHVSYNRAIHRDSPTGNGEKEGFSFCAFSFFPCSDRNSHSGKLETLA